MSPSTLARDTGDEARPAKRSRVAVACQRCKGRRQKCDNAAPACSNCARSKAACTYPTYPTSYVNQLEERVGQLEARLRSVDPSQADDHLANNVHDGSRSQMATPSSIPTHQSPAVASSPGHLASGIGLLSSCATAEPHYFGFSSGLNLAHFIEAAITTGNGTSDISLPLLADRPFSRQIPTAQTPLASAPSRSTGSKYIRAYLSSIHPLYPFIDREEIWRVHDAVTGEALSTPVSHTGADLARLHLIYAIGSRCIQLLKPRKVPRHLPEGHLMSAMQHIPEMLKVTSIHTVEVTLLLAIHSMRSPSGTSVWHLCGFAMRQCLELGLHRPKPHGASQAQLEQQRRKLFWSVYIFERKSALVLGRPFAISDKDVDISMPDDDTQQNRSLAADISTTALHRHHILLYRIHSKIRSTLHNLKRGASNDKVQSKVTRCLELLEGWKHDMLQEINSRVVDNNPAPGATSLSQSDSSDSADDTQTPLARSSNLDKAELLLEYHKARRSLLQPLLTDCGPHHSPTLSDYTSCADASGQICQHYRLVHRLSALPFTLRDLHAVLIAGFTSLYCIAARPILYNAQNAGAIGACSTVLYVIAEQWEGARRYRDTFETVAEKLVAIVTVAQSESRNASVGTTGGNIPAHSLRPEDQRHNTVSPAQSQNRRWSSTDANRSLQPGLQTATVGGSSLVVESGDSDLPGIFGNILEDSFAIFDVDYEEDGLRELLMNEGFDWFAKG